MTGYHYTSADNWERIKREGLIPYRLNHSEAFERVHQPTLGIWVYTNPQNPVSHKGCLRYQATIKHTNKIVLLLVQYQEEDRVSPTNNSLIVYHRLGNGGRFSDVPDDYIYHDDEPAHILYNPIPSSAIQVIGYYHVSLQTGDIAEAA